MTPRAAYLFAGGGTGGHLFPGLAVADELLRRDPRARVLFVGSGREIERAILGATSYEHVVLPAQSMSGLRRNPMRFLWRSLRAMRQARRIVRREAPAAVVGLGGFASVPVVLAASRGHVRTVLLEQNSVPGRATRWLSRRASLVCLTFEESRQHLPRQASVCVTGNPVRERIAALREHQGTTAGHPNVLLVLGGSQGAAPVNAAMTELARTRRELLAPWRIVHQTGPAQREEVKSAYQSSGIEATVAAFFEDMGAWYGRAGLVVSRAGATTLAELACAGCPALLVPYPQAADDHQRFNAECFARAGAARVAEQGASPGLTARRLAAELSALLPGSGELARMQTAMRAFARPDAAARVVDRLESLVAR